MSSNVLIDTLLLHFLRPIKPAYASNYAYHEPQFYTELISGKIIFL